jgi:tetratricopeptide (TPR) repeat protein
MLIQEGSLHEGLIYLKKIRKIDREEPAILTEIEQCEKLIQYKRELDDNKIINDWNKCYDLSSKLIKKCNKCFEIKLSYLESMVNSYQIDDALNFYKNDLDTKEQKLDNVQFLITKAYFNDGKYEKSKQLLMNLISNTKDIYLIEKIKKLSEKLEQIEALKEKANKFYKNNNFSDAINVYNELLSLDNNNKIFNALILSNRSLCYYKIKDMFNALHDINASIKLNDKYWKSFQRRANINIKLKYSEQAKDDLRKVLELDPMNREASNLLEEILKEERRKGAKDLYMLLGVSRNSSNDEIRKGFKKLAAKWHPDKNNETEEKKNFAEKKFKEINAAYNILSDPYKREIYDKTGKDDIIEQKYKSEDKDNNKNYYKRERSRDQNEYMKEGFHY